MTYTVSKFKNQITPPIFGAGKGNSYIHYNYRTGQLKNILPIFLEKVISKSIQVDQAIRLKVRVVIFQFRKRKMEKRIKISKSLQCQKF